MERFDDSGTPDKRGQPKDSVIADMTGQTEGGDLSEFQESIVSLVFFLLFFKSSKLRHIIYLLQHFRVSRVAELKAGLNGSAERLWMAVEPPTRRTQSVWTGKSLEFQSCRCIRQRIFRRHRGLSKQTIPVLPSFPDLSDQEIRKEKSLVGGRVPLLLLKSTTTL